MCRKLIFLASFIFVLGLSAGVAVAGVDYEDPEGGWTYIYTGDAGAAGSGFTALDGTWSHDNASDQWDESEIGSGRPGGVKVLTQNGVTYVRLQDTGDPRDHGPGDPSNRKISFGHSVTNDIGAVADTLLDDGVTISFRARLSTTPPLDNLNPDGGGSTTPWPAGGDGYVCHDGGKSVFGVRQPNGDQIISFALSLASENPSDAANMLNGKQGLTMNSLNGTSPSSSVDIQQGEGTLNILEIAELTVWHEFWITIQADTSGGGTHKVKVYVDGSSTPTELHVTSGTGNDYNDSYISFGTGSTDQSGAIDMDFFAYKPGLYAPVESKARAKASNPNPGNGQEDVPRDVILSWTPGESAPATNGHKVYFSENFNDVNDGIGGAIQNANSYTPPAILEFSKTYYWRVDEVNGPPDYTIYQGNVWQFTTEPLGYPIDGNNITATASSSDAGQGPENTVNRSGLDANDLHSNEIADMWLSGSGGQEPAWLEYEFDKVYKLHEMWVWNFNGQSILSGFGLKNVTIKYSANGTDYTTLGTTHELPRAPGTDGYAHDTPIALNGAIAKYVRITANSNWGGATYSQYGLSEVRFFYIPVRARRPSPDTGATGLDPNVVLGWRAGRDTATHELYLSTDKKAVTEATTTPVSIPVIRTEADYDPLSLDLGKTYYWKVNEVNMAETPAIWEGDLWDFRTVDFIVVDDFEDYDAADNQIWYAWHDGLGYGEEGVTPYYAGNGTGSAVGDETTNSYTEETIVHEGRQAMPYFYDNNKQDYLKYSEAELTLSTPQDWTKHNVKALSLWFYGDPNNAAEQMYVKLNDSKVIYDGAADDIKQAWWQQWDIDLASFGVDLRNVKKICIGFGDDTNMTPGGSGKVYFDDIRLYPPRCVVSRLKPVADITGDCVVDFRDIEIMANDWLMGDFTRPGPLLVHYKFDEGAGTVAADSSGNGNDGAFSGTATWGQGRGGGYAAAFDGRVGEVRGDNTYLNGLNALSFGAWIKSNVTGTDAGVIIFEEPAGNDTHDLRYDSAGSSGGGTNVIKYGVSTEEGSHENESASNVQTTAWQHVMVTWKSGEAAKLYINGVLDTPTNEDDVIGGTTSGYTTLIIGRGGKSSGGSWNGLVDDVRVYEVALTAAQVQTVMNGGDIPVVDVYVPLESVANLYDEEPQSQKRVNFKDFAILADEWLEELVWPEW